MELGFGELRKRKVPCVDEKTFRDEIDGKLGRVELFDGNWGQ